MSPTDLSNILPFVDWPNVTSNVILHINDSWFLPNTIPISEHRSAFLVACILMHDRFHTAYDVAHGFIEYPAVRGLTKRNSKRHSSHQRFLISSKHNTDQWTPIGIFGSVHLDARQISHRIRCAHGFIEYRAVRGLTQCNFERHSSHQRFLISCNKLHATREIKSSAVDFSDVLNVVAW